jgi:hypothetical protein
MSRVKPSIIASLLLALMLLPLAVPVAAQDLVIYADPIVIGVTDVTGVQIGDVDVQWSLDPDDEGGWVVLGGCEHTRITEDTGPDGVDLFCYGTAPEGEFGGGVNIVRQAAPPEVAFQALKQGVAEQEAQGIYNEGQADSLLVKLDVAELAYDLGAPIVASNVLHAFQNELVALSGSIPPEWTSAPLWLLAESLIRVVTPSM